MHIRHGFPDQLDIQLSYFFFDFKKVIFTKDGLIINPFLWFHHIVLKQSVRFTFLHDLNVVVSGFKYQRPVYNQLPVLLSRVFYEELQGNQTVTL